MGEEEEDEDEEEQLFSSFSQQMMPLALRAATPGERVMNTSTFTPSVTFTTILNYM